MRTENLAIGSLDSLLKLDFLQQRFAGEKGEATVFEDDRPIEHGFGNVATERSLENQHLSPNS